MKDKILKVNNCNSSSKKQSKRQKKMAANMEEKCPLCLETLEMDDLNFYPCKCGYQVCRFCWHRIRTNENGLCPACRRQYPEDPANFKPLSQEELQKLKSEKKMKEIQKKKEMAENRKQLANVRVLQKNLVFVHGLPVGIDADEERFRKLLHIFKEFGPVLKCVINNRTNYAGSQSPRASAYVTYQRIDDALKAYKSLPTRIEGHDVKTSLGTTKYCSNFLKNVHCPKQDCMYLHEIADDELCFTKDQIHAGDHLAFGNILYERMMAPPPQKASQNNHSKETLTSEQEVVTQSKPSSEVLTKLKEDSSSCSSDESSANSPRQSRLQHLFCNREPHNGMFVAELERQFGCHINSNPAVNNSKTSSSNSEKPVQRSLSLEESTVNTTHNNNVKNYQNFLTQKATPTIDEWLEQKGQSNGVHSNHLHQNGIAEDFNIANSGNPKSSILSRLSLHNNSNGTTNSLNSEIDFHTEDDDLGFDPLKISLEGLEDLVSSENKETLRMAAYKSATLDLQRQRTSVPMVQQALNLLRTRTPQQQPQRQRNPPPGFSVNNFPSNQPLSSPVFESRNVLPTRMSPVINASNSYNPMRTNYQVPRFPSVSLNSNSLINGYTSQPIRNMSPQSIPLQAQAMHELLSRSTPTSQHQHIQTQSQNLSQTQFPPPVDQNLSPSYWSMNQSQWMQPENSFQNQSMTDFRPASPLLNLRRMQSQQLRPATDYSRQMHQLTARYNNLSPFSENPQFMYPNNSQHNQLPKGVHTFP